MTKIIGEEILCSQNHPTSFHRTIYKKLITLYCQAMKIEHNGSHEDDLQGKLCSEKTKAY